MLTSHRRGQNPPAVPDDHLAFELRGALPPLAVARFLIDESLPRAVGRALVAAGHDVIDARDRRAPRRVRRRRDGACHSLKHGAFVTPSRTRLLRFSCDAHRWARKPRSEAGPGNPHSGWSRTRNSNPRKRCVPNGIRSPRTHASRSPADSCPDTRDDRASRRLSRSTPRIG